MLVEMAIGDAYGSAFEMIPIEDIPKLNDLTYRKHPKWNLGEGCYTDDTQMAMALSEFFLYGQQQTSIHLADYFVQAYQRDPRPGYMPGLRKVLTEVEDGQDFVSTIIPNSIKSGGAMRAAPCGLIENRHEAVDMAMWQASLTHATKQGLDSAAASALLVWFCLDGCSQDKLGKSIKKEIPGYPWDEVWKWPVKVDGIPVVRAAIMATGYFDSLKKILQLCIAFSGDTDTVAVVAMAAASMHPKIKQDLSDHLYTGLENGTYGRDYLETLDWHLLDHFHIDHPHGKTRPDYIKPMEPLETKFEQGILDLFGETK